VDRIEIRIEVEVMFFWFWEGLWIGLISNEGTWKLLLCVWLVLMKTDGDYDDAFIYVKNSLGEIRQTRNGCCIFFRQHKNGS
jgi:hypothetical protein